MGLPDDAKDTAADRAEDALDGKAGRDDDLTARPGEGLTQPGPPTDPDNPTG